MERLQKFLAHQGIGSRRAVEKMIAAGRISVNKKIIINQGVKIDPTTDRVTVDGKVIKPKEKYEYIWLNKPPEVLSAASSKTGELTVVDLVDSDNRLYPVGRLDKDSQGLLLLTNDGELTHRLTHPKYHIPKTYEVFVSGKITTKKIERLQTGIKLSEGMTQPAEVEIIEQNETGTWLEFVLHEGKHRQIRRMCATVDLHVIDLIRVKFGPVEIKNLKLGKSRSATSAEISTLYKLVKLQ